MNENIEMARKWNIINEPVAIYKGNDCTLVDMCEEAIALGKHYNESCAIASIMQREKSVVMTLGDKEKGNSNAKYPSIYFMHSGVSANEALAESNDMEEIIIYGYMTDLKRLLYILELANQDNEEMLLYSEVLEKLYVYKSVYHLALNKRYAILNYMLHVLIENDVFDLNEEGRENFEGTKEDIDKAFKKALDYKEIRKLNITEKSRTHVDWDLSSIYEDYTYQSEGSKKLVVLLKAIDKGQQAIRENREIPAHISYTIDKADEIIEDAIKAVNSDGCEFLDNSFELARVHNLIESCRRELENLNCLNVFGF